MERSSRLLSAAAAGWLAVAGAAALGSAVVLRAGAALVDRPRLDDLAGRWAFHPGDDARWAAPAFDDSAWARIALPGSWGRQGFHSVHGLAWYRLRVQLPRRPTAAEPWGITLGKIDSAYEVHAGGLRLGGVGGMPPRPRLEYDRHRTYSLPAAAVGADGTLVVALRVWRAPGKAPGAAGPVEGPFLLGPLAALVARDVSAELAVLGLVLVFLLAGFYHLLLRLLRPQAREYGWFGLLAVLAAAYCFLRTQWKYALWDDFLVLKKTEHLLLYVLLAVIVQFHWVFLGERRPRWLRAVQAALLAGGVVVVLAPGLRLALAVLPFLQLLALGIAVPGVALVWRRLRGGDEGARAVALGVALLIASLGHDALVDRGFLTTPRLAVFGFGAVVVGMSASLAQRFHRVLHDLDALTHDLESRVVDRTSELARRGVELTEAYRRMEELAMRDGLTGLLNRRAVEQRALACLAEAERHRQPFALALVDVDHFKALNDAYGHAAGDAGLVHVARCLASAVREYDVVGRWGGEEFLVLLPGSGTAAATTAAERLRLAVEQTRLAVSDEASLQLTVSAGVAAVDGDAASLDELLRTADGALYRAKAAGRNQVLVG